jgi:hypothetical protein
MYRRPRLRISLGYASVSPRQALRVWVAGYTMDRRFLRVSISIGHAKLCAWAGRERGPLLRPSPCHVRRRSVRRRRRRRRRPRRASLPRRGRPAADRGRLRHINIIIIMIRLHRARRGPMLSARGARGGGGSSAGGQARAASRLSGAGGAAAARMREDARAGGAAGSWGGWRPAATHAWRPCLAVAACGAPAGSRRETLRRPSHALRRPSHALRRLADATDGCGCGVKARGAVAPACAGRRRAPPHPPRPK